MSRLFLHCGLCGRKQADGLISRNSWGHLETGNGSALRACPTCKEQNGDWETKLRSLDDPGALDRSAFGSELGTSYGIAG